MPPRFVCSVHVALDISFDGVSSDGVSSDGVLFDGVLFDCVSFDCVSFDGVSFDCGALNGVLFDFDTRVILGMPLCVLERNLSGMFMVLVHLMLFLVSHLIWVVF